ncbi:hypothetical protein LCGC14_1209550, partial [marine sediment metagenome]
MKMRTLMTALSVGVAALMAGGAGFAQEYTFKLHHLL